MEPPHTSVIPVHHLPRPSPQPPWHTSHNRWRVSGHFLFLLKSQFPIGKRLVRGVPRGLGRGAGKVVDGDDEGEGGSIF